jgi:hypothetical protein
MVLRWHLNAPLECIQQTPLGVFFFMANDLLDDNGCLIFLQSFDDASTMELFCFAHGRKVSILTKNIYMHQQHPYAH